MKVASVTKILIGNSYNITRS